MEFAADATLILQSSENTTGFIYFKGWCPFK